MPAIQRYKIHPQRDIIHEVTGLNGVGSWRSQNSIADSSTTTSPILNLIAGGCWARRQLRSSIKDVSVASKPRNSLTLVSVVFIDTLALPELDVRFLHNHCSDPESDCGRPLGSTPATQWYKGRLCRIRTQEIADPCESCLYRYPGDLLLDGGLLHNRWTDFDSVCEGLLGSTPASKRYKVRPCHIETHEIAVFCAGCIRYQAGDILLDGRLLHNRWTDLESVCEGLLGSTPASQRYKVRPCHIKAHEIAVFCAGCIRYQAGDILLDGRLLHNRWMDFAAFCGRLLDSMPATRRYRVRPRRINTQEIADSCGGCLYRYSGDPRTRWLIPPQPLLRS